MKAITVMQPWATLIAIGAKTIETRPAPPNGSMRPEGVRGLPGLAIEPGERIAIHAGATPPTEGLRLEQDGEMVETSFVVTNGALLDLCNSESHYMHRGAVIATAVVEDAMPVEPMPRPSGDDFSTHGESVLFTRPGVLWGFDHGAGPYPLHPELPLGDFTLGRWGWLLGDVIPSDPVPVKGKQGVWQLPDGVAALVSP